MEHPGIELMTTLKKLEQFYDEKLTNYDLMTDPKTRIWGWSSLYVMGGGVLLMFLSFFIHYQNVYWTGLGLLFLGILFADRTLRISRKLVFDRFPQYKILARKNLWSFEKDILFAYRVDQFAEEIRSKAVDLQSLKYIIGYLNSQSNSMKINRWFPFSILAVVFFPLWSEYVGYSMNGQWATFIKLSLIAFFLTYITIFINSVPKKIIWSRAIQYQQLAELLEVVLLSTEKEESNNDT